MFRVNKRIVNLICFSLLLLQATWMFGCTPKHANRNPLGEQFPKVTGKSLDGKEVSIPKDVVEELAILIIGYKQNAQFDIDRWLLGLFDSGVEAPIYEIPTITGVFPGMIASKIDGGMRSGIPQELWQSVVTVYTEDAKKLALFAGNERPLNARVFLVNKNGLVLFFHYRGYSVSRLRELTKQIKEKMEG